MAETWDSRKDGKRNETFGRKIRDRKMEPGLFEARQIARGNGFSASQQEGAHPFPERIWATREHKGHKE